MKVSSFEKPWVKFVKNGRLDEAFSLYVSVNRFYFLQEFVFPRFLALLISNLIIYFLPALDENDTAEDLNTEFLIFWKRPNLIGGILLRKILLKLFLGRKVSARALAWYAHWLVFQGAYKQAAIIFRHVLKNIERDSRLRGEVLSLVGNYFYSRDKYEISEYFHDQSDNKLKTSNDIFFQIFNLGTSAKTYAVQGKLDEFNRKILAQYDFLNPVGPDERYGLRVLIYGAYLNFTKGKIDVGKQFYSSAEKCFIVSGSPLDKSVFCMYKAAILFFFKDLEGAKKASLLAKNFLSDYGRYQKYENEINDMIDYFYKDGSVPLIIKNLLRDVENYSKKEELEQWYHDFFSEILPIIDSFQSISIEEIVQPLAKVTNSTVKLELVKSGLDVENIHSGSDIVIIDEGKDATTFEANIYHSSKLYNLTLVSHYKKWRNPDFYEATRSLLIMLCNLSRKDHLKMIMDTQSQKIKESEIARRIAHDIYSPLTALNIAVSALDNNISCYNIIKSSTKRISEITMSLSRKREFLINKPERFLVKSFMDTLISCKKVERNNENTSLSVKYLNKSSSQYLFLLESELSRTISNLINNAFEACSHNSGEVEVVVGVSGAVLTIRICDNGTGIEGIMLSKIFEKDFTDKKEGSGLGLYYAKKFIESCHGNIVVSSELGVGTIVSVEIPLSTPPSWIKTNLFLYDYHTVVIADEFEGNRKLISKKINHEIEYVNIVEIDCPKKLVDFLCRNKEDKGVFYIIDYEFSTSSQTGLSIIENNEIQSQSVLSTNYFENSELIDECLRGEIKVVPKIIFNEINIYKNKPKIFVVDDEKYFLMALKNKISDRYDLNVFNSVEEMLVNNKISKDGYYFIDRHFRGSVKTNDMLFDYLLMNNVERIFNISGDESYFTTKAVKINKDEILNYLK